MVTTPAARPKQGSKPDMSTIAFSADDFELGADPAAKAAQPGPPRQGPGLRGSVKAEGTAPFVVPGSPRKKKHGRTLAFDGADLKAAVEKATEAAKVAASAPKADLRPPQGDEPPAKNKELMATMAFGDVIPDLGSQPPVAATQAKAEMAQTKAFGAEDNDLMSTVAYANSPAEAAEALERLEAKTAEPAAAPPAAPRQGRKKPKWGATMAFGAGDLAQLKTPPPAEEPIERAPTTQRHPGVGTPQAVAPTASPKAQGKSELSSTMAFESPREQAEILAQAQAAAAAKMAGRTANKDLSSTLAFTANVDNEPRMPRPAAGAPMTPAPPPPDANLASTLAFESPGTDGDIDALFGAATADPGPVAQSSGAQLQDAADGLFESAAAASKRAAFKKKKPVSRKRTMMGGLKQVAGTEQEAAAQLAALREERQAAGHEPPAPTPFAPAHAPPEDPAPTPVQAPSPPADALGQMQGSELMSTVASHGIEDQPAPTAAPPVVNVEMARPVSAPVQPPAYGQPMQPMGGHMPRQLPAQPPGALQPAKEKSRIPLMLIVAILSIFVGVGLVLVLWKLVL